MKSKKSVKLKASKAVKKSSKGATPGAGLGVKDVCDIIDKCKQAKVSSLSFRGLSLIFGHSTDERSSTTGKTPKASAGQPKPGPLTPEQQRASDRQAAVAAAHGGIVVPDVDIDNELEQLKVTDPQEYERRVNSGEYN